MGTQNNHLNLTVLLSWLNVPFRCKIRKLIVNKSHRLIWRPGVYWFFCTALWLIILIIAIFGLWRIQSEKIKAVRPRVRLDNRNPWYDKMAFSWHTIFTLNIPRICLIKLYKSRSDCSCRNILIRVYTVCHSNTTFYTSRQKEKLTHIFYSDPV